MKQQEFEATYAQMTEAELARVLRDRRDLVPEARSALDVEIGRRHLDPAELHKLKPHSIDKPRHPTELEKKLKGKRLRPVWIVVCFVLSVGLAATLGHFGALRLFWPICITILVPVFTLWGHWELKGRPWFWAAIALIVAAHVTIFFFIGWPWGEKWIPARSVEGLMTLDLMAIFGLISLVEKMLHEDGAAEARGPAAS
ncbi:MAG: hypothetical protein WA294_21370 [Acidobacteriaceae bacterium]